MHLKKIKLVGFKSFVEQTVIHLPNKIAAIVGPNGCGKSNVIDAVRWVMGESSAKQLRGSSMSDVIFNGSTKRKPSGRASIELTFDNSDVSIGGEYAKYSEIAVRRDIERDGGSDYFLNGARCRRRDIIDVFLGTGLGPNSYAIIEQGTISQFIEAKPEDLRLYLEEAAGISKYKERRRETENRIQHTRDNLLRLNDIRSELERQLKSLKSQANTAERYKKHKSEERQLKAELHVLHWQKFQQQQNVLEDLLQQEDSKLKDKVVECDNLTAKISLASEKRHELTASFNLIQEKFYRLGTDTARKEQQLLFDKEQQKKLQQEITKFDQVNKETIEQQTCDQGQLDILRAELNKISSDQPEITEELVNAENDLQKKELSAKEFRREWDSFQLDITSVDRSIEVENTKLYHVQQNVMNEEKRLQRLLEELESCAAQSSATAIIHLEEKRSQVQEENEQLRASLATQQQEITNKRVEYSKLSQELDAARHKLQILAGKYASLEALQEAALGKNDSLQKKWLLEQNIAKRARLLQEIKVESGWEKAVEVVLSNYLDAICIDDLAVAATWQELPANHLMLVSSGDTCSNNYVSVSEAVMPALLQKVTSNYPLVWLLSGVYVAEDLNQALSRRSELGTYESIVTRDGIWLGQNWLWVPGKSEVKSGVIQRERELEEIKTLLSEQQSYITASEQAQRQQQTLIVGLEQHYHELQQKLREVTAVLGKIQGEINAKQQHIVYIEQRKQSLQQEITAHENILRELNAKIQESQQICQAANSKKTALQERLQQMQQRQQSVQQELIAARELVAKQRQTVSSNTLRLEMLQKQIGYLQNNLDRTAHKLAELVANKTKLQQELVASESPLLAKEQEVQQLVAARFAMEKELEQVKQIINEHETELSALEEKRATLQDENQLLRDKLEKIRLEIHEMKTRKEGHVQQIIELNYLFDDVLSQLSSEASIAAWEEKLLQLCGKIERLGSINLAAIDEYTKQAERKDYLDKQNQDLVDALDTLQAAIKKIDNETKEKFQEVFASINQRFQEIFPRIFNGGRAYLQLMTDDLLEAGVMIFAQPPGKRNSSIHLLSGGEKALTAIALIFAIFQLNPAPFCMLDEVDAPLDDVNVVRFCNLIKEIARNVQLVFISHNKLTMEIADQLTGVTMQETGVSRIVDVDMQKALKSN